MAREDWVGAVSQHYSYANLRELQDTWVEWVRRGSSVEEFNPNAIAAANAPVPQQSFDNDVGPRRSRTRSTWPSRPTLAARRQPPQPVRRA